MVGHNTIQQKLRRDTGRCVFETANENELFRFTVRT